MTNFEAVESDAHEWALRADALHLVAVLRGVARAFGERGVAGHEELLALAEQIYDLRQGAAAAESIVRFYQHPRDPYSRRAGESVEAWMLRVRASER